MDSGHDRMIMDAEGDRLSILPDDLILKILSFVGLKDAIGTSVLSPRWRYLWTSIPHLSFSTDDFSTMDKFSDFVTHVLSRRNNQARLSFLELYLRLKDGYDVAQRIVNCALSHNVQQVKLSSLRGKIPIKKNIRFSLSLLRSQTPRRPTYISSYFHERIPLTSTVELSSLTTLRLDFISLYDGFFSTCPNLENLTLYACRMLGSDVFRIIHPRLSNLMIKEFGGRYLISAPKLASLLLIAFAPFMFSTDGLNSLENAQLSLHSLDNKEAPNVINLLQNLHNVKDLSLSMDIIQFLNLEVELISHQPSPFTNLKSLKILPTVRCVWKGEHVKAIMSTEVKNYLLNSSSEATLTEVLCDSRGECGLICKKHKTGKWL